MANEPKVSILITAKDLATKVVEGVKSRLTAFGSSVKSVFSGLNGVLAGLGIASAGAALSALFTRAIEEAAGADRASLQLRDSVERLGLSYDALEPKISAYVDAQAAAAALDNDDVATALATLVTRSGDLTGSMEMLNTVLGLSAKEHMDLNSAADLVGRAMTGQLKPLRALGITTKDQSDALRLLRDQYAGFAEKEAATFEGMQRRLSVGWANLLEAMGRVITQSPVVRGWMDAIAGSVETASTHTEGLAGSFDSFIASVSSIGSAIKIAILIPLAGLATVALPVASALRGIAAAFAEMGVLAGQAINLVIAGMNKIREYSAKSLGRTPELIAPIDVSGLQRWRDQQIAQIKTNGAEIANAWKAAGGAIGEAMANASLADERNAARREGRPAVGRPGTRQTSPKPKPRPGGTGGDGEDEDKKRKAAEAARAKEIATLTQLVELRKIDAAGLQRLYELQRLIAEEAQAEADRVKEGIGDRERLLALLKQQADIAGTLGTTPTVTSGPSSMPQPATTISIDTGDQAALDLPTPDEQLPEWLKRVQDGYYGVSEATRVARGESITFGSELQSLGGGAIASFQDASLAAFQQIGNGSKAMGRAFAHSIRAGIADAAKAKGQYYFTLGTAAVGEGLMGNAAAFGAAAKFFLAAAGFFALGNIAGGGAGGSGGSAGSQSSRGGIGGELGGDGRGKLILYMPDGASVFDPNDPRMVELWANMLGQITDREVVLTPGSRPR